MPKKGSAIAIDGPDGVGKTTQVNLLSKFLADRGHSVHTTRASGGTPIGELLRTASTANVQRPVLTDLYISLAMHTALGEDIQRRRREGQTVIIDRSPAAIIAYQIYGSQLEDKQRGFDAAQEMFELWDISHLVLLEADRPVVKARLMRAAEKDEKKMQYFEKQGEAFAARVAEGYRQVPGFLKQINSKTKVHIIKADKSVEDIEKQIVYSLNNSM